jgi:tripartite-type tricarboxylate transporter receptor subunit TctC
MKSLKWAAALAAVYAMGTRAVEAAPFQAKTITIDVGYSAGGLYDLIARLIAKRMGDELPGHPTVVVQNMPGAGGATALMYLYAEAPRDGSVLAMTKRSYATDPIFDQTGPSYDPARFTAIGSISSEVSVAVAWYKSKIKKFSDTYQTTMSVGATSVTDGSVRYALMTRALTPAKLHLVAGYPGGNDITLAMERGEVDGKFGWSWGSVKSRARDLLESGKLNILMQMGLRRAPDLPNTPFIMDYAKTDLDRKALELILAPDDVAWPLLGPPGLPPAITAALRTAFDKTMQDPGFKSDAAKLGIDIDPITGAEIDQLVSRVTKEDAATIARARQMTGVM